jgi:hypothetical protein
MFSNSHSLKDTLFDRISVEEISGILLRKIIKDNNCVACIVIDCTNGESIEIIASEGIEIASFRENKKDSLLQLLMECYSRYPNPHIHNISKSKFWSDLTRVCNTDLWAPRFIYLPVMARKYRFIIVLFFKNDIVQDISNRMRIDVMDYANIMSYFFRINDVEKRLEVVEGYVKEVGHDIASSVQAVIPKLRNIRKGVFTEDLVLRKIEEAEDEIMSAFRSAETLGVTIDTDYNINTGSDFYISEKIEQAVKLCQSEADEKDLRLNYNPLTQEKDLVIWGDEKAVLIAVIQLLLNAIKYSNRTTDINLDIKDSGDSVEFSVTNTGTVISEEERQLIWMFGYRGSTALELHVNGSGIGLFTVRKIVRAHSGEAGLTVTGLQKNRNKFYFKIPKRDIISCPKLYRK